MHYDAGYANTLQGTMNVISQDLRRIFFDIGLGKLAKALSIRIVSEPCGEWADSTGCPLLSQSRKGRSRQAKPSLHSAKINGEWGRNVFFCGPYTCLALVDNAGYLRQKVLHLS